MPRQFQFSLSRLFVSTTLIAIAFSTDYAATQCDKQWNAVLFIVACVICGIAFGCLWRLTVGGAIVGLLVGVGLVICAA
jgi:hypothetical protein